MNLFGLEIKLAPKNGNGNGHVKREDCHTAMDNLKDHVDQRLDDFREHIDKRFDDFKDFFTKR